MLGGATAAPVPQFQAAGTLVQGSGNISPAWPAHAANDIGLLFVVSANQAVATPDTWNAVTNGSQGVGTGGSAGTATRLQVFWRRATTAAEAAAAVLDGGVRQGGVILTFRGCVAVGDPVNISAGDATANANTTAVAIPGATTTLDRCLVVAAASNYLGANTQTGETNASLANLAERFDNGTGIEFVTVVTGVKAAAGTYSTTTATLSGGGSKQGRVSLALIPA